MFEVSVKTRFSAAHRLIGYPGSCAAFHGHNWDVEVCVRGSELGESGILLDFRKMKEEIRHMLEELDHADLNAVPAFQKINPTSENVARYLYGVFSAAVNGPRYRVHSVSVHETPECRATYWEDDAGAGGAGQ